MISSAFPVDAAADTPPFYRLERALLRLWFRFVFRRVRVLQAEQTSRAAPRLLVVNHPFSLAHTLAMVAALDRNLRCLAERRSEPNRAVQWLSGALGVVTYDYESESWPSVVEGASTLLGRGGAVMVFARQRAADSTEAAGFAPEAAEIALEAQGRLGREAALLIHPVHVFWPAPPSSSEELLIYVDSPVPVNLALLEESDFARQLKSMDAEIERACHRSPLRLHDDTVSRFIAGLEGVMREDLAETWSRRRNWKQSVDDLELSPFLVKLTHQVNDRHPARLAALCERLAKYREAKRRASLGELKAETAGGWFKNKWLRLGAWLETVIGFPVACYGLLNLIPAWLIARLAGLLRDGLWRTPPREWMLRVLVAIGCYTCQIALAATLLPRWEAGIYAPSILFSGAYALRYLWLTEHRIPVLAQSVAKEKRSARLRRMRRGLIDELKQDQDRFASLWNLAH
ncbi:MAG: 1-acyl-sn-glycerol-3-phosphate acyltransferase [Terriglobia bacterium]